MIHQRSIYRNQLYFTPAVLDWNAYEYYWKIGKILTSRKLFKNVKIF